MRACWSTNFSTKNLRRMLGIFPRNGDWGRRHPAGKRSSECTLRRVKAAKTLRAATISETRLAPEAMRPTPQPSQGPLPAGKMPALPEDVFYFVEERGVAVRGLVVHFQRGIELFHDLALLARQLGGRQHPHMIIKIAAAAAVRVGQSLALDAEYGAALRAFRNF